MLLASPAPQRVRVAYQHVTASGAISFIAILAFTDAFAFALKLLSCHPGAELHHPPSKTTDRLARSSRII